LRIPPFQKNVTVQSLKLIDALSGVALVQRSEAIQVNLDLAVQMDLVVTIAKRLSLLEFINGIRIARGRREH